jgi:hypothetical protein
MKFAEFLSDADAERAVATFRKLRRHGLESLALTGGFAIESHLRMRGQRVELRPLNDIDFLAEDFEAIPKTLAGDFIFRHVHPHDAPGKTLLQAVDSETAVRVDVFRAYGAEMARAETIEDAGHPLCMVSIEDLAARSARLSMDLAFGTPMPAKHARDFQRLLPLVEAAEMEPIWQEHRKPAHPESFAETAELLRRLIPQRTDLQIVPDYSRDVEAVCQRCQPAGEFPLAEGERVLALLGYC